MCLKQLLEDEQIALMRYSPATELLDGYRYTSLADVVAQARRFRV